MILSRRDCLVASSAVGVAALGRCLTSAASDERPEYRTGKTLHVSPDGMVTQPFEVPEDLRWQYRLDVDGGDVKAWIADHDQSGSDLSPRRTDRGERKPTSSGWVEVKSPFHGLPERQGL